MTKCMVVFFLGFPVCGVGLLLLIISAFLDSQLVCGIGGGLTVGGYAMVMISGLVGGATMEKEKKNYGWDMYDRR